MLYKRIINKIHFLPSLLFYFYTKHFQVFKRLFYHVKMSLTFVIVFAIELNLLNQS